jgi:ABC-type bacteriocin/lantibiotic exporter with double-glycine peptidase domain
LAGATQRCRSFANEDRAWQSYAHVVDSAFRLGIKTEAAGAGFGAWMGIMGQGAMVLVLWCDWISR